MTLFEPEPAPAVAVEERERYAAWRAQIVALNQLSARFERARSGLARALFRDGYSTEAVLEAACVTPGTLLRWCTNPRAETVDDYCLVPEAIVNELAALVEDEERQASARRERRDALAYKFPRNRRHAEYRALVARAERMKAEDGLFGEGSGRTAAQRKRELAALLEEIAVFFGASVKKQPRTSAEVARRKQLAWESKQAKRRLR